MKGIRMRKRTFAVLALVGLLAAAIVLSSSGASARRRPGHGLRGPATRYVVVYERGVAAEKARAEIRRLGGDIISENLAVGVATVVAPKDWFVRGSTDSSLLVGVARDRIIGWNDPDARISEDEIERVMNDLEAGPARSSAAPGDDALAPLQWGNQMIHATAAGSYAVQRGSGDVLVGIIDTGINARHPDLRRNFNRELSRNFTRDIPVIDGPCRKDPDESCQDPATVDEGGHGTHVAGTVGAAFNNLGVAGVAPKISLVNLRAGQDSGFFFLQPSVDALTYAADNGIDVVNMSYYIDPWLYNCTDNPADSPEAQAEQAAIIEATQRAVDYAHEHNVTLIGAAGNEHTDLGNPTFDDTSPDFPPESAYPRNVDNSCLDMPTEANNVLSISAVGPSGRKAYYSNYGVEQTTVSAPGGDVRDFHGTPQYESAENLVLSTYPRRLAVQQGLVSRKLVPRIPVAVVDCRRVRPERERRCGVYVYLQGTSMAAPHATGVAALIVSSFGETTDQGMTMGPDDVLARLRSTATDVPCPSQNPFDYPDLPPEYTATCEGDATSNGFYGAGVVDALEAVTAP
jgi:lantibiotic leader peptide-processing serine protease